MQAQLRNDKSRGNGRVSGNAAMGGAPATGMGRRGGRGREPANPTALMRAIRYVGHYRRLALLAYGSLFLATAAQLAVPQLIQNIIDQVVKAYLATQVLTLPGPVQTLAAQRLGLTIAQLQANQSGATAAIATAM